MSVGTIYLRVKLRLDLDLDEDQVDEFVSELDYNVTGSLYEDTPNIISDTEIVGHEAITSDDQE